MADLLSEENSSSPAPEVDPAAEFLAREQDELAGLEDDNFGSGDPAPASDQVEQSGGSPVVFVHGGLMGDDLASFESDPVPGSSEAQLNGPSDSYSSISQVDRLANEPEKIKKWREEQKEMLAIKDDDAEDLQSEWREIAKKEIVEWTARQAEQFTKAQSANRAAEKAFIDERDEETPGEEWERIARLCDFNPKNNKNCKDVTRLRSILLHLKQTGMAK